MPEEVTLPDPKHEGNVGKLITGRHGVTPRRAFDLQQHRCENLKTCKSCIYLKVPLQKKRNKIDFFFYDENYQTLFISLNMNRMVFKKERTVFSIK